MTGFQAQSPHYRADIDGLRALAILPVVLFHFRVPGFFGGFVGVDVFFVISGYLITSLIHGEMAQGRFSIVEFCQRRIRRIFPALFAMLAVATVAAAFVFFPADFALYARSLVATAFFASNFEFRHEAGYFDAAAELKPLLHLWSIAVEEQFYLLFPAILLLTGAKSKRRTLVIVAILLAASFGFSLWAVTHAPADAFYLLPSRMWELMLGAMLAIGGLVVPRLRALREAIAIIGLALIGWSVFALTPATPFPGLAALAPCLGAALVIYAGSGRTAVNDALSVRPLVFVGLISYSLYLWHWPLYVFTRYVLFRELTGLETAGLIAASFVLAFLCWRFIERPFRERRFQPDWKALFGGAAAAMATAAACGAVIASSDGWPQRYPSAIRQILAEERDHEPRMDICFGLTARDVRAGRLCRVGSTAAKHPSFILWGDSHADALLPAVEEVALREGRAGLFAGTDSCAPLLGVTRPDAWKCRAFNDEVIKIATGPDITEVILDARWAKNADGTSYGDEPPGRILIYDDQGRGTTTATTNAVFVRGLERTVRTLTQAGKKVILVGSVPEIGWPVPIVLARMKLADENPQTDLTLSAYLQRQHFVLYAFAQMNKTYGAKVIYPHQVLCATGTCKVALRGIPLYRDQHHLSVFGARQLTPLIAQAF